MDNILYLTFYVATLGCIFWKKPNEKLLVEKGKRKTSGEKGFWLIQYI